MSKTLPRSAVPDLVRFLSARLADDATEIDRLLQPGVERPSAGARSPVALRTAARLHAELDAKQTVLEQLHRLTDLCDVPNPKAVHDAATSALRAMVNPYRAHPEYDREWTAPQRL